MFESGAFFEVSDDEFAIRSQPNTSPTSIDEHGAEIRAELQAPSSDGVACAARRAFIYRPALENAALVKTEATGRVLTSP